MTILENQSISNFMSRYSTVILMVIAAAATAGGLIFWSAVIRKCQSCL